MFGHIDGSVSWSGVTRLSVSNRKSSSFNGDCPTYQQKQQYTPVFAHVIRMYISRAVSTECKLNYGSLTITHILQ